MVVRLLPALLAMSISSFGGEAQVFGTILTLVFLPAVYAIWFKIEPMTMGLEPALGIRTARVA